jgi:hypothetical protein
LVILGAAKGGTTDIWNMLHTYHSKYNSVRLTPWQTEKELNLLDPTVCQESLCNSSELYYLLRCPYQLLRKTERKNVLQVCYDFQQSRLEKYRNPIAARMMSKKMHTLTARPSLLFSYTDASKLLMQISKETHYRPLFIVLLRQPVHRIVSLYNHGQV